MLLKSGESNRKPTSKYLLLIEKVTEYMAGADVQIIARFADSLEELEAFAANEYPDQQTVILPNTAELEEFFELSSLFS